MSRILSIIMLMSLVYACQSGQEQAKIETAAAQTQASTNCQYTFNAGKTQVKWVAFKTPRKVGVGGSFAKVDFQLNTNSNMQLAAIFSGVKFEIDTKSVKTGHEGRDAKIVEHFFGRGIPLTGVVKAMDEKSIDVELTMNGASTMTKLDYVFADGKFEAKGVIDVITAFAMNSFLEAINKACLALHEGKTWSDVEISIISELDSVCQ